MGAWEATMPDGWNQAAAWPQTRTEFEALVGAMQHGLVRFAYRRLHSLADAEDVVQDVLVRAYLDRERLLRIGAVEPYLYRMVANRSADLLRQRRRAAPLDEAGGARAPEPEAARLVGIEALLAQLPARQAEAIRLRIFAELPFETAARVAGVSTPTLKSRFRYGVEKLRKLMGRKEASC